MVVPLCISIFGFSDKFLVNNSDAESEPRLLNIRLCNEAACSKQELSAIQVKQFQGNLRRRISSQPALCSC